MVRNQPPNRMANPSTPADSGKIEKHNAAVTRLAALYKNAAGAPENPESVATIAANNTENQSPDTNDLKQLIADLDEATAGNPKAKQAADELLQSLLTAASAGACVALGAPPPLCALLVTGEASPEEVLDAVGQVLGQSSSENDDNDVGKARAYYEKAKQIYGIITDREKTRPEPTPTPTPTPVDTSCAQVKQIIKNIPTKGLPANEPILSPLWERGYQQHQVLECLELRRPEPVK